MNQVDVVIIIALKDEYDAVLAVSHTRWQDREDRSGFPYVQTRLPRGLTLALAQFAGMGGIQTANRATQLVSELQPPRSPEGLSLLLVCRSFDFLQEQIKNIYSMSSCRKHLYRGLSRSLAGKEAFSH